MKQTKFRWGFLLASAIALLTFLTSCGLPRSNAADRVFLDLSLDFLGEYQLPKEKFNNTPVGGLSAITYNRQQNLFYAVSDDRSQSPPARFYTLKLILNDNKKGNISLNKVQIEDVTFLGQKNGENYQLNTIDSEGIAFSPQKTVFISSEGGAINNSPPFINEFDLKTGKILQSLPIPERYIPDAIGEKQQRGVQDNKAFESLTFSPTGSIPAKGEPIRLFTATESALVQDRDPSSSKQGAKCRLLHYLISDGPPLIISEHLYQLDTPPAVYQYHGLTDLLALDAGGHFLGLERSLGLAGFNSKIFQVATGGATDTSRIASFKGDTSTIEPVKKKLLLDLNQLDITLDNLEGMTLGPRLPDGSQSLLVVSDDNFSENQVTQFLLFRLNQKRVTTRN